MGSQGLVALMTAVAFILPHTVIVLTASEFTMQPVSVVQAQGVDAVFECRYPGAQNHNWGLNGEFPTEDTYPPDVTVTPSSNDIPATLTIPAIAQYNNTVVQCEAVVRDGRGFISKLSVNATLHLQGLLPAVADLAVNNVAGNCSQLNVTWDAPFSLNLTTAEPDIRYCVDVYDEREKNMLQSECNITTTQYLFDIAYHVGTYSFSVTPRSNIDGSLNGIISTGQFSYEPQVIPIDEVDFTTNTELNPLRVTFPASLIHECRAPDKYSVQIQYIDREVADPCNCSTDQSTGNTQMIVLDLNCSSCNIEHHERCSLTLLAESNQRNTPSVMMTMIISTHDVYKVTDFSMKENGISITVDYIPPQSNDTGYIAIVYSVDSSSSDVHYQVVYQENTSPTVVGNLTDHVYKLAVFDLNDVMKPERKLVYPAVLPNTTLDNGTTEPSAGGQVAVPNPGGEHMNATEVNGTICISCNSSCVGIIHSQYGLDQGNITLIPRTVTDSGQNCTENMPQGMYFAAIFSEMLSYKTVIHIDLSTSTASDTHTDALTPVTNFVDNSTTVIGGIAAAATAAAAATTVVIIAFLVVIAFVWRRKRREKRTLVVKMQNTSLLENDYGPPLSLNREYSVSSEAAGGPPPIPAYQYENVELMSLTRATEPPVSIDEPPSYYAAATCTSKPFKQDMDESSVLSSSPDHVPISANWTGHNVSTLERSNHDTAPNHSANNRVTQAMGASENEQCVYLHMERGTSSVPHDQSVEPAPKDPVYDVAKKDFANSTPTQNNNKTETPIQVVYADLDVNLKANSTPPMQHPVVYALIDGSSLAPRSNENNTPCILPSLSPPPTAESVLAEIYPVAKRWEALGEALGIKEHHLDSFSTEGHEQVCLHDMILYYFNFGPHSWEDIVKALWEIGETEAADKIIRSGKCTVELLVTSPTETPPPLPPRNDTAKAASHQTEAGDDWQDDGVQESDTLNTKEHHVTQDSVQSADDQGELDEYNSGVHFPRSTGVGNKSEDGPTGRKNNSLASTLNNTINEMPCFPIVCKSAVHDPILDKEEPTVPYCTTMIHSLGVFKKLDVPRNHKVRALGYLNSGQSALLKNLYQQRMAAADEVHENNVSHVVPQNDDTAIENNGYTVKQSFGDSSSIPLLKRDPSITSYLRAEEVTPFTRHPATCSTDDVGFAVHVGCFTGFEMPNLPRSGSDMSLDSGAPLDILKKSDTGEENELRRSAEAAAEIYKASFKEFPQQRVILAPTILQDAHSGCTHSVYKKLKIKVEEEFHSFEINRLHYFKNVVKTILKLPPHISTSVREGCVEICFEVIGLLADEAFHLTIDQKQEMLANNITLLEYDGQVPYCCCELLGDKSSRDTIKKLYDDVCQTDYQNDELNGETVTSTPNTNDIQSTRVRDFPSNPTTWAYFRGVRFKGVQLLEHGCIFQPENLSCILFYPTTWAYLRGVRFEGVQLLEHGCIFQPENGDICHLEVVSRPGELELDRQVQRLHFEYLITSDDECLLSQCLHNTVQWLTNNMFSRCPLIQWMVTRLLYFDQFWLSVWNAAGDL